MITNKIIWITGASSGLGKALAKLLSQNTNHIFVTARNEHELDKLATQSKHNIFPIVADVSNKESMRRAAKTISDQVDHIDLLVVCAGTCEYQDGYEFDIDMYERVFSTNFYGCVNTINVALPLLIKSNQAPQIVGIGSLSSILPFPRAEAYGASKAAMDYFLNSLRIDLQQHGVHVNLIRPGFIDTPMTKKNDFTMPFMMNAGAAAELVIKAIKNRKRVTHFPYQLSWTLRLFSLFPSFWEFLMANKIIKRTS